MVDKTRSAEDTDIVSLLMYLELLRIKIELLSEMEMSQDIKEIQINVNNEIGK